MPENPSFFKVLIAVDFKKLLRFPPAFSWKHRPHPGTKTKLRSPSGATWKVKVEKMENGTLCFTKGWQNFAEDAALQLGEVVFFTRVAPSEFDVSIYKTNFCERQIPHHSHASMNNPHEYYLFGSLFPKSQPLRSSHLHSKPGCDTETTPNDGESSSSSSPLYFEVRLKYYHTFRVYLPKEFAVAGELEGKSHVRMEFVRGKGSGEGERVVLDNSHGRTDLANGWSKFRVENGIVLGKIYLFELTTHLGIKVILVKECQKSN